MISMAFVGAMASFSPHTIPYGALADAGRFTAEGADVLREALSSSGIVQVTGVPGYAKGRKAVLEGAAACGTWSQTHTFDDATTRRTMATHTIPGPGGAQPFNNPGKDSAACREFAAASEPFRDGIDGAVRLFGARLAALLRVENPLLATPDGFSFDTLNEVVDNGEHLEHIHSYSTGAPAATAAAKDDEKEEGSTLAMHTDMGLFIAFTPALSVSAASHRAVDAEDASRFHLTLPGGEVVRAAFDSEALVFMLGQGTENIVKPKLVAAAGGAPAFVPRATPHSLSVASHPVPAADKLLRMWYGRMVLPPSGASVAGDASKTYGALRDAMNEDVRDGATSSSAVALGCSGAGGHADRRALSSLHRRVLSEPASCTRNGVTTNSSLNCWHRCMPLANGNNEPGNTADDCAERGLLLQCVNFRDQLSPIDANGIPNAHGDYFPQCTNTTATATALPSLPAFLQTAPTCPGVGDEAALLAHASAIQAAEGYAAMANLTALCGGSWGVPGVPCLKGAFLYTAHPDGKVEGKMVAHAGFGWMSIGFSNPGGKHNGMNGGQVVMALPGAPSAYSPYTGLDVSSGPTVHEYVITEDLESKGSSFRFWSTPFASPSLTAAAFEKTDCHTALSFTTSKIANKTLNVGGTDDFMWGFNTADAFVGYHGRENRGLVTIDWTLGALCGFSSAA